jgi:RHS repeat-associated protein
MADEDVDGDNQKFVMNLRFPGQYFDSETGTHYNINRDYNPLTGRYIQSDPIGFDGGVNGFGYAEENTLINIDANRQFAQAIYLNPVAYTNPI